MSMTTYAPVARVLADERTRDELGQAGTALALTHMWLGDCQSCNGPLRIGEPPALVAADFGSFVEFSLHHSTCREPVWCDMFMFEIQGTKSFVYRPVDATLPTISPNPMAVLLVNPSVERVRLARGGDAASPWRLDRPVEAGFAPLARVFGQSLDDADADVVVRESSAHPTTVEVWIRGEKHWECDLGPTGLSQTRELGGLLVLLSNAISPAVLDDLDSIASFVKKAFRGDICDAAWAPLTP